MNRCLLFLALALSLSGCGFLSDVGRGARDGFAESLPSAVANVVADKLQNRDATLAEAIRNLPGQLPKPAPPVEPKDNTVAYGIAFLLAKLVGDGVGGIVRSKVNKGGV